MRRAMAWVAWCALAGCNSQDSGAPAADASDEDTAADLCSAFTTSGAPCPFASAKACFPECATGGCFCLESANGGAPRWSCKTDTSCFPDGSPLDDVNTPSSDGGDDAADASTSSDASNAGDADASNSGDAPSDAADSAAD